MEFLLIKVRWKLEAGIGRHTWNLQIPASSDRLWRILWGQDRIFMKWWKSLKNSMETNQKGNHLEGLKKKKVV